MLKEVESKNPAKFESNSKIQKRSKRLKLRKFGGKYGI